MAKSSGRPKVKLVSTAGTGHYYTTDEHKSKKVESMKKYDPVIRKHVLYKRAKIS